MAGAPVTREEIVAILGEVAGGATLKKACENAGRDYTNIWKRIWADQELATQYARAQDEGVDARLDEAFTLAYAEQDVNRARLICDNAKWWASKRRAKQYGDRLEQHITSEQPKSPEDVIKAIKDLEQRLGLKKAEDEQGRALDPAHTVRARDDIDPAPTVQ